MGQVEIRGIDLGINQYEDKITPEELCNKILEHFKGVEYIKYTPDNPKNPIGGFSFKKYTEDIQTIKAWSHRKQQFIHTTMDKLDKNDFYIIDGDCYIGSNVVSENDYNSAIKRGGRNRRTPGMNMGENPFDLTSDDIRSIERLTNRLNPESDHYNILGQYTPRRDNLDSFSNMSTSHGLYIVKDKSSTYTILRPSNKAVTYVGGILATSELLDELYNSVAKYSEYETVTFTTYNLPISHSTGTVEVDKSSEVDNPIELAREIYTIVNKYKSRFLNSFSNANKYLEIRLTPCSMSNASEFSMGMVLAV